MFYANYNGMQTGVYFLFQPLMTTVLLIIEVILIYSVELIIIMFRPYFKGSHDQHAEHFPRTIKQQMEMNLLII